MKKATVWVGGTAGFYVKVTVEDNDDDDTREEKIWEAVEQQAPAGLCHHCSSEFEVEPSNFEPEPLKEIVWEDEK